MKYDYERIALWSIVVLLVVAVFFQQRRSGFSVQAGAETSSISLLDMMEYKYIPEMKRSAYRDMLMSNATALTSITDGGMYRMKVDQMMMTALNMPVPPTVITSNTMPTPPTSGLQFCTGTIIVGDCASSNVCPPGLTQRTIGNLKYCVCPRPEQKMVPPSGPGKPPMCVTACPISMPKLITEGATGQQMCVPSCPPKIPDGYRCL
jgi:hypothetical protein